MSRNSFGQDDFPDNWETVGHFVSDAKRSWYELRGGEGEGELDNFTTQRASSNLLSSSQVWSSLAVIREDGLGG